MDISEKERLREVFLDRQGSYSLPEAARLTGFTVAELRARIQDGSFDAEPAGDTYSMTWPQLYMLAADRWPLTVMMDALGDDAPQALPILFRLEELRVRLPEYLLILMRRLADRAGLPVDDYLETALGHLTSTDEARELQQEMPNFDEAWRFPDERDT